MQILCHFLIFFQVTYFTKLFYDIRSQIVLNWTYNYKHNSIYLFNHVQSSITRCRTMSNNWTRSNWHDPRCVPDRTNRILSLPIIIKVLPVHWPHVAYSQNSTSQIKWQDDAIFSIDNKIHRKNDFAEVSKNLAGYRYRYRYWK